jgi:hypothetical protein
MGCNFLLRSLKTRSGTLLSKQDLHLLVRIPGQQPKLFATPLPEIQADPGYASPASQYADLAMKCQAAARAILGKKGKVSAFVAGTASAELGAAHRIDLPLRPGLNISAEWLRGPWHKLYAQVAVEVLPTLPSPSLDRPVPLGEFRGHVFQVTSSEVHLSSVSALSQYSHMVAALADPNWEPSKPVEVLAERDLVRELGWLLKAILAKTGTPAGAREAGLFNQAAVLADLAAVWLPPPDALEAKRAAQIIVRALGATLELSHNVPSGDVPFGAFATCLANLTRSLPTPSLELPSAATLASARARLLVRALETLAEAMAPEHASPECAKYLLSCAVRLENADPMNSASFVAARDQVVRDLQDLSFGLPVAEQPAPKRKKWILW